VEKNAKQMSPALQVKILFLAIINVRIVIPDLELNVGKMAHGVSIIGKLSRAREKNEKLFVNVSRA